MTKGEAWTDHVSRCQEEGLKRTGELVLELLVAGVGQGEPVWSEWAKNFVYGTWTNRTWSDAPHEVMDVDLADAYGEAVERLSSAPFVTEERQRFSQIRADVMRGGSRLVRADAGEPGSEQEFDEALLSDGLAYVDRAMKSWLEFVKNADRPLLPARLVGGR